MKIFYPVWNYMTKFMKCSLCALPVAFIMYGTFEWWKIILYAVIFIIAWKKIKLTKNPYQLLEEEWERQGWTSVK